MNSLSPSKKVAYTATTCALLIACQAIFSIAPGVEVVTLIFICFAYSFGRSCAVMLGFAFSLLRCVVFGFSPTALILYLAYYPLLGLTFAQIGKSKIFSSDKYVKIVYIITDVVLLVLALTPLSLILFNVIKTPPAQEFLLKVLLYVLSGILALLFIIFNLLFFNKKIQMNGTYAVLKVIFVTVCALTFTILFTMLDNIITPLYLRYSQSSAEAYFYTSFLALIPQCVCVAITVSTLFSPITKLFENIIKGRQG